MSTWKPLPRPNPLRSQILGSNVSSMVIAG